MVHLHEKKKATEPWKTWYQDHIINPFTPIIYHKPEKEWAKDQFWKLVFTQHILGTTRVLIFNLGLQYCTYDRQNYYYTIWQKNEETGPDPIFSQFWGQTSVAPNSQKMWVGTHPFTRNPLFTRTKTTSLMGMYPIFLLHKLALKVQKVFKIKFIDYSVCICFHGMWMVSSTARAKYSLYNVIIKLTQTENNHNPKPFCCK